MDLFPNFSGFGSSSVVDYFDDNTVTAMWNYAQAFSMSDNSYGPVPGSEHRRAYSIAGLIVARVTDGIFWGRPCEPDGTKRVGETYTSPALVFRLKIC
jgi:phospholipase C